MDARKFGLAMALVAGLGMSGVARATLILSLTDGISSASVIDVDGDGEVIFNDSMGVFIINVAAGWSKPSISNPGGPADLELNVTNVSTDAGTMVITLTDDNFAEPASLLEMSIGGITDGTVTAQGLFDNDNGNPIITPETTLVVGPIGAGAFAGTTSAGIAPTGPYALGVKATIVHGGGQRTSSFDVTVSAIPEPATLALIGLGFAGLGFGRRRTH